MSTEFVIGRVNLNKRPRIYATNNPAYYGKYCIDFFPNSLPTIAGFETAREAHDRVIELMGEALHEQWFPELYTETYCTCIGCRGYQPERTIVEGLCLACRGKTGITVQTFNSYAKRYRAYALELGGHLHSITRIQRIKRILKARTQTGRWIEFTQLVLYATGDKTIYDKNEIR
jgi:hypothetical protein